MIIITIHNDGTGSNEIGNYDYEVLVTVSPTELQTLARGRVEGHERGRGWEVLLDKVSAQCLLASVDGGQQ